MRGWVIRILIIAAIAVGAFVFRDRLWGNAAASKSATASTSPSGRRSSTTCSIIPATEAHNSEVIFVGNMTGANETYPTDDVIEAFVETNCLPAYKTYPGRTSRPTRR